MTSEAAIVDGAPAIKGKQVIVRGIRLAEPNLHALALAFKQLMRDDLTRPVGERIIDRILHDRDEA